MPVFNNEQIKKIISLEKTLTENIGENGDKPISIADLQVSLIQIYSYTGDDGWNDTVESLSTEEEKAAFDNILKFQSILEDSLKRKSDASQKQYEEIRIKANDPMEMELELKAIEDEIQRYENRGAENAIPQNKKTQPQYLDAKIRKAELESLKNILDNGSFKQLNFSNIKYDEVITKEQKLYILEGDFSRMVDIISGDVEKELNMAIIKASNKKEALIKGQERKYTKEIDAIKLEPEYKNASKDDKPLIMERRKKEILAKMEQDVGLKEAKAKIENEWVNNVDKLVNDAEQKAKTLFAKSAAEVIQKKKDALELHAEKNYFYKKKTKSGLKKDTRRSRKQAQIVSNDIKPEKQADPVAPPKDNKKSISLPDERIKTEKDLLKRIEKMNQDAINTKYTKEQREKPGARLTTNMAKGGFVGDKGTKYVIDLHESKYINTNLEAYRKIYGRELAACESTFYQDKKDFRIGKDNHFARLKAIHNILASNKKFGFTSNSAEYTNMLNALTDFEKKCKDNGWDKLLDPDKQDISKLTPEEIMGRRDMYKALHDVYVAAYEYMSAKGPGAKTWSHGEKRYELAYLLCNEIYSFGGHAAECESRISEIEKEFVYAELEPSNKKNQIVNESTAKNRNKLPRTVKNGDKEVINTTKQISNQANARTELGNKYQKAIDAELKKMGIAAKQNQPEQFIDNNIRFSNTNMIV